MYSTTTHLKMEMKGWNIKSLQLNYTIVMLTTINDFVKRSLKKCCVDVKKVGGPGTWLDSLRSFATMVYTAGRVETE